MLEYIGIIGSPKSQITMQTSRLFISIVIVCVIAAGIGGYAIYEKSSQANTTPTVAQNDVNASTSASQETTAPTPVSNPSEPATTTNPIDTTKKPTKYKDGTYTATGSYNSPGGPDRLGLSVTIKDDVVTSTTATNMAGDRTSSRFQQMFIGGYQALVVGKNIDSIHLDVVSGSSLTPKGFNDALAQIKVQAKA